MGGFGSGCTDHWWRPPKKPVVERCLFLDANRWTREGILKSGVCHAGSWGWTYPGGKGFSVRYEVNTLDPGRPVLRLAYSWAWAGSEELHSASYALRLTTTRPHFGGLRWWFVCPLVADGRPCNRRVGKLYLPPRARHFGCRHCHSLTYTSCQHHDKRVDALRRDPESLAFLLHNLETVPPHLGLLAVRAAGQ